MAPLSMKSCALLLALVAVVAVADRGSERGDRGERRRPPVFTPFTAPAATDILVIRYGWAPVFCFAGSGAGATPVEFCGLDPPSRTRFRSIRPLRMYYATATDNLDKCPDPTPGYVDAALDWKVKKALACIDNSYSLPVNDDAWNAYVWNLVGTCVAEYTGMDPAFYFKLIVDLFARYNPDFILKQAGIDTAVALTFNQTQAMDVLEAAWGYRGFCTCDTK